MAEFQDNEPYRLRRAGTADVAAIRALTRAAYSKWVPLLGREPLPMTTDYDHAVRNHAIDLICCADRVIGLIEMVPGSDHLLIENVAVDPAAQGRGLGLRLLTHAEDQARMLHLPEVRLYTNALFAANLRLYRKLGYELDREEPFKGGAVLHFKKAL